MEQKIEYLTNEYIIDWLSKHCLPQSEIDELNRVANEAASKANDSVSDEMIENNEEISFNIDDFPENDKAFSAAMFKFADRFRDNDDIEDKFQGFFGTKVKLDQGKRKGKIIIEYNGNSDLERILDLLK